jgi:hypothetical protein
MTTQDFSTIAAIGVLVAAFTAFMAGFGIDVPLWIPSSVVLGFAVGIFGLRAYIAFVGEDNTTVDEKLAKAEKLIASARGGFASEAPTRKD